MRALSIRQPWAWLIVNGHKPVENREWSTSFRGPLVIHAGVTLTRRYYTEVLDSLRAGQLPGAAELPAYDQLERGGIVGMAELVDCVEQHGSPYFTGPFGFVLRHARPLPFLAWKGQLGYFDVPRWALNLEATPQ